MAKNISLDMALSIEILSDLTIATICAVICLIGFVIFNKHFTYTELKINAISSNNRYSTTSIFMLGITISATFLCIFIITSSTQIAIAIACLASALPYLINKQRFETQIRSREMAWPEAIDSLVSGLQSGISISDAVLSLSEHGPEILRPNFMRVKDYVRSGGTIEDGLKSEKQVLQSAISDQVFETLLVAKEFGGRDANNALRLLSEFIRDDIDVIEEVRTKFGWIRNSAVLATAAPWILLVLLSSQESTVVAFSTSAGVSVLCAGVAMTGVAYFWMQRVGKLPEMARALR
jgi:tight adherence protein B